MAAEGLASLELPVKLQNEVQRSWSALISGKGTKELVGEAIFTQLFEDPKMERQFKRSRAEMALRFSGALDQIILLLDDAEALKADVELLAFRHMQFKVNDDSLQAFQRAIFQVMELELGDRWTRDAQKGWNMLLDYVGKACAYVVDNFSQCLSIINSSWAEVKAKKDKKPESNGSPDNVQSPMGATDPELREREGPAKQEKKKSGGYFSGLFSSSKKDSSKGAGKGNSQVESGSSSSSSGSTIDVPQTFEGMVRLNASLIGADPKWMDLILGAFEIIVSNASNPPRLKQETDILALRMHKETSGNVKLSEFKVCMLASLRALVPKRWDGAHEQAWSWLWDNTQGSLQRSLPLPGTYEKPVGRFIDGIDEKERKDIGLKIFKRLFKEVPASELFFKQSNDRLCFIISKLLDFSTTIYKEPSLTVADLQALGLRHIAYDVPTAYFAPFVMVCEAEFNERTKDPVVVKGMVWALKVISNLMVSIITEQSTAVLKAVVRNDTKGLKKALVEAPRGERAAWVLGA